VTLTYTQAAFAVACLLLLLCLLQVIGLYVAARWLDARAHQQFADIERRVSAALQPSDMHGAAAAISDAAATLRGIGELFGVADAGDACRR